MIDKSYNYYKLEIPSGYQTGIKIVHGFDIADGQATELVLDFDASKSVVKAGNSGKWLLKPTIKVIDTQVSAMISGKVTDSGAVPANLDGVSVSFQIYDPDAEDIKNKVVVQTSTITDTDGLYSIYLDPGTYNMVLSKEGYTASCAKIEVLSGFSYSKNFMLRTAQTGTIIGKVIIENPAVDQNAVLSFRQNFQCENSTALESIEIKSVSVTSDTSYEVSLPPATCNLVAATEGRKTQEYADIALASGDIIPQDIFFAEELFP